METTMTVKELTEKISAWENSAGESFFDYFAHDRVKNTSWAFWLLGKGFKERGNQIIEIDQKDNGYVDQEILYEIYPVNDEAISIDQAYINNDKNIELMAEFLLDTPVYTKRVMEWFEKQNQE